jgi:hypothetical protein
MYQTNIILVTHFDLLDCSMQRYMHILQHYLSIVHCGISPKYAIKIFKESIEYIEHPVLKADCIFMHDIINVNSVKVNSNLNASRLPPSTRRVLAQFAENEIQGNGLNIIQRSFPPSYT